MKIVLALLYQLHFSTWMKCNPNMKHVKHLLNEQSKMQCRVANRHYHHILHQHVCVRYRISCRMRWISWLSNLLRTRKADVCTMSPRERRCSWLSRHSPFHVGVVWRSLWNWKEWERIRLKNSVPVYCGVIVSFVQRTLVMSTNWVKTKQSS